MKDYFSQLVEVVKKALEENKEAALDKKRLKTASRVGTQCARNCDNNSSPFPAADIRVDAVLKQGNK
jgi:hypothetical protein